MPYLAHVSFVVRHAIYLLHFLRVSKLFEGDSAE
jgi:hypothetical protein